MTRVSSQVLDEFDRPVQGAQVYILKSDGTQATLTLDGGGSLLQPVNTDSFGSYYYNTADIIFRREIWYGGKKRWVEQLTESALDASLRTDLSAVTGAALVGTSQGDTVEQVSIRPRRVSLGSTKARAYNRATAIIMAQDLSYLKGWAKNAVTTGGAGKPVYWVTRSSDDPNTPGTLRYAITQATAGGGGQIIFDPRKPIKIVLSSRVNVPSNCTISAPGRNVKIRAWSNTALFNIDGTNVIIQFLNLSHLIDTTGINNKLVFGDPGYDAQQGGPADQADAITVVPTTADKIWIDQCTFEHLSDGAIDFSSSAITHLTAYACRYSVSRCIFRDHYKTSLCGSSSLDPLDTIYTLPRQVFGSYYENWFDHTAERHPRTGALGYSDNSNNIIDLCRIETDDGIASGSYGLGSLYGGWARTRGDLIRSLDGVASLALQCSDGTAGIPESAAINEGSVAEGALTIQTRNTSTPTALPLTNYDLTPASIPADGPARETWRRSIQAAAGAEAESFPRGVYIYDASRTDTINGITVRAAPDHGGVGRWLLDDDQDDQIPQPEALSGATAAAIWTRGSNKTLATDTLTIDGTATVWAVSPETGSADNISTINGIADNQLAIIRPASSIDVLTII